MILYVLYLYILYSYKQNYNIPVSSNINRIQWNRSIYDIRDVF